MQVIWLLRGDDRFGMKRSWNEPDRDGERGEKYEIQIKNRLNPNEDKLIMVKKKHLKIICFAVVCKIKLLYVCVCVSVCVRVLNICSLTNTNTHGQTEVLRGRWTEQEGRQLKNKWTINTEPPRVFVHVHSCTEHLCSLPVAGPESCVCIILVTMVSSKNCAAISLEFVLGNVSMRLLWWIPVQLHNSRGHNQMSGLRPNT